LTLQLSHRDIDLVIKNEKHMKMIIEFLIHTLKTLDGSRDSAKPMLDLLMEQKIRELQRSHKRAQIADYVKTRIMQVNEAFIYRKVKTKYTIIRIRNKLSYMAFMKGMTVAQLFLTSILRTYQYLQQQGLQKIDSRIENLNSVMIKSLAIPELSVMKVLLGLSLKTLID
jgi:hypothetical protein